MKTRKRRRERAMSRATFARLMRAGERLGRLAKKRIEPMFRLTGSDLAMRLT